MADKSRYYSFRRRQSVYTSPSRNGAVDMRYLRRTVILSLLAIGSAAFLFAQEPKLTDAQLMDLAAPIKAVSTIANRMDVSWQETRGPSLIVPVLCWECEFDPRKPDQVRSDSCCRRIVPWTRKPARIAVGEEFASAASYCHCGMGAGFFCGC